MQFPKLLIGLIAVAALAACGGSGSSGGPQNTKIQFSRLVSFGDSLSDVGSYRVGGIAALRGGQFTINGVGPGDLTGLNWIQLLSTQLGLPAPCAAQTGLNGDPALGFRVPVVNHPGCTAYGQGGARIFDPIGPGNAPPLGNLTVPLATQVQNHLAGNGNRFNPNEIVFIMGGANEVFTQLGQLAAGATAAGQAAGAAEGARVGAQTFAATLVQSLAATATNPASAAQAIGAALAAESARPGSTDQTLVGAAVAAAAAQPGNAMVASPAVFGPLVASAQAAATTAGQAAGATAGEAAGNAFVAAQAPLIVAELGRIGAAYGNMIRTEIVGKGANQVVLVNMPGLSRTPFGFGLSAAQRDFIRTMTLNFNEQLRNAVAGESKILLVDAYTANEIQIDQPAIHGLSNVTAPACDLSPARNPIPIALTCNTGNVIAGDVGRYLFADSVHPTPFGYLLLARLVSRDMVIKGWL